jgi:hypothetical protein
MKTFHVEAFPALFSSPEYFPLRLNYIERTIDFVRLSIQDYQRLAFLDHREVCGEVYQASLDSLLSAQARINRVIAPIHYVLHTAHCCSTLLARCLEQIPSCFVLKEPFVLTQLVWMHQRLNPEYLEVSVSEEEWHSLLELILALLSRTYQPDQTVIIKVNDVCNPLGQSFLKRDIRSRILFTYNSLPEFLLAVLKSPVRREWLRDRALPIWKEGPRLSELAAVELDQLSDTEYGAYLWLENVWGYEQLLSWAGQTRVEAINGCTLAENPQLVMKSVLATLGLPEGEVLLTKHCLDEVLSRDSKNLELTYSNAQRQGSLVRLKKIFNSDIQLGLTWVKSILGDRPSPIPLE